MAKEANKQGFKKVGLYGTKFSMEGDSVLDTTRIGIQKTFDCALSGREQMPMSKIKVIVDSISSGGA